jgi:hypothetical protein
MYLDLYICLTHISVLSSRRYPPTGRANRFYRFSNSAVWFWTQRKIVVWASSKPLSDIMATRAR